MRVIHSFDQHAPGKQIEVGLDQSLEPDTDI
jgi:hypothetical protein